MFTDQTLLSLARVRARFAFNFFCIHIFSTCVLITAARVNYFLVKSRHEYTMGYTVYLMKVKRTLKPNLSLKKLREITGLTQRDFSVMVGVSLPLIKMVECGLKPLTEGLAGKILIATGGRLIWWDFSKIRNGKVSRVPVPNGKIYWVAMGEEMTEDLMYKKTKLLSRTEYSREHFDYHRRFFKTDPPPPNGFKGSAASTPDVIQNRSNYSI